jgi:hypothetical protein
MDNTPIFGEGDLPTDPQEAVRKLTREFSRPVWVRVWRKAGVAHLLDKTVERPLRRGELAQIEGEAHTIMLDEPTACWKIKYGDGTRAMLPIKHYVWELCEGHRIRLKFVDADEEP